MGLTSCQPIDDRTHGLVQAATIISGSGKTSSSPLSRVNPLVSVG
jgi:hypothetical protein